jgi:hypothetical protein
MISQALRLSSSAACFTALMTSADIVVRNWTRLPTGSFRGPLVGGFFAGIPPQPRFPESRQINGRRAKLRVIRPNGNVDR